MTSEDFIAELERRRLLSDRLMGKLRDLLAARPFAPFVIHTADSRDVDVSHPEAIAYGGGRIAVVGARWRRRDPIPLRTHDDRSHPCERRAARSPR